MATSKQGTSVVKHLSQTGRFQIRAITRDPSSEKALFLSKLPNVEVLRGDLLDKESLKKCFIGVYGIFGNTTPTKGWLIGRGSMDKDYELEQGRNLIDIVSSLEKEGNLKHFIFSSICKAKDPLKSEPAPSHFSNKWLIEDYIKINKLQDITTFLRPVSYFENFNSDLPGLHIKQNMFPGIVSPKKPWQTIAVDDIGLWAMAVFLNPKKFLGEELNIAGEELTGEEMASTFNQLEGNQSKKTKYFMIPKFILNLIEHDISIMASWIERAGYGADLKKLKTLENELGITTTSLKNWLLDQRLKEPLLIKKSPDLINTSKFKPLTT